MKNGVLRRATEDILSAANGNMTSIYKQIDVEDISTMLTQLSFYNERSHPFCGRTQETFIEVDVTLWPEIEGVLNVQHFLLSDSFIVLIQNNWIEDEWKLHVKHGTESRKSLRQLT